jgi:lipoprotein signal peptidase
MRRRFLLTVALGALLAAADLAVKVAVTTPAANYHTRSGAWSALVLIVVAGCLALARVPSTAVALAAGVTAGGAAANVISCAVSGWSVENPLVVGGATAGVAFNLADVFALTGILLLMVTTSVFSIRNRERLRPPRRRVAARFRS